jgi:hypothetical protein
MLSIHLPAPGFQRKQLQLDFDFEEEKRSAKPGGEFHDQGDNVKN